MLVCIPMKLAGGSAQNARASALVGTITTCQHCSGVRPDTQLLEPQEAAGALAHLAEHLVPQLASTMPAILK